MSVYGAWLAPYAVLELGWDSPIIEAVAAYWRYVKQEVDTWSISGPQALREVINEAEVDIGVRLSLILKYPDLVGHFDVTHERYQEVCMRVLSHHGGGYLWHIKKPTLEMCLTAVRNYPDALREVHEKFLTEEVCRAAVEVSGLAIVHAPRALQALVAVAAVRQEPDALAKLYQPAPVVVLTAAQQYLMRTTVPEHLQMELVDIAARLNSVINQL